MASDIIERWKASVTQHSISFVYRSYCLPMPDPSPSTLTVLQLPTARKKGVAAGHSGQFTPGGYLSTLWYTLHCTLVGLQLTTFRWLGRRATDSHSYKGAFTQRATRATLRAARRAFSSTTAYKDQSTAAENARWRTEPRSVWTPLKARREEKGLQFLTKRRQWRSGSDWGRQIIPRSWCSHWESTVAECWL